MAVVNIYETNPTIERLVIVDPANVEDQNIYNKTGEVFELTFAKDTVLGGRTILEADDTIPLGVIRPGESYTVTAQQINDAIAAGNHSDIFLVSKKGIADGTIPARHVVIGGITQPGRKTKAKTEK